MRTPHPGTVASGSDSGQGAQIAVKEPARQLTSEKRFEGGNSVLYLWSESLSVNAGCAVAFLPFRNP